MRRLSSRGPAAIRRQTPKQRATDALVALTEQLIRHLGFWSLNGTPVLYCADGRDGEARFGFAYGTLPNHAESGEELFGVFVDGRSGDVMYRIRAMSWPQTTLTRIDNPSSASFKGVSAETPPQR